MAHGPLIGDRRFHSPLGQTSSMGLDCTFEATHVVSVNYLLHVVTISTCGRPGAFEICIWTHSCNQCGWALACLVATPTSARPVLYSQEYASGRTGSTGA